MWGRLYCCFVLIASLSRLLAAEPLPLLDLTNPGTAQLTPSSAQVSAEASGLIRIAAGDEGYPGIRVKPANGSWDLSSYGHVAARIRNLGTEAMTLSLRVDNPGDWRKSPWNVESLTIPPSETRTLKTIFGYHNGYQKGFDLDPSQVSSVLLFTERVREGELRFQIESLEANGLPGETPPINPAKIRIWPEDGFLFGGSTPLTSEDLLETRGNVQASAVEGILRVEVSGGEESLVRILPPEGRWDLSQASELRFQLGNVGSSALQPEFRALSDGRKSTDWVALEAPLDPGARTTTVLYFETSNPWRGPTQPVTEAHMRGEPGTGTDFESDKVAAIELRFPGAQTGVMGIASIQATAEARPRPEWLGSRPPVENPDQWTLTFEEEFTSDTLDTAKWNVQGPNYWGAKSLTHWSRDNVIVKDGTATIRLEKKRGYHNDDPQQHESDYAGGYLDTYDKFRQRYGYFEARMKLPTASGLWPAFWLMPDRGRDKGEMWRRQQTDKGGMEFDIMEHLTRWGPYRYNIAMHWDGYGQGHKSVGTGTIYTQADEDGFITCGLLWTPGSAIYYCNGREVGRYETDRISNVPSMIMFTLPIGGWDNGQLKDDELPGDFTIDYVKVWQRKDLASFEDGFY